MQVKCFLLLKSLYVYAVKKTVNRRKHVFFVKTRKGFHKVKNCFPGFGTVMQRDPPIFSILIVIVSLMELM